MAHYVDTGDAAAMMDLLWGTATPGRRGPRQRLDRERIVAAAIELADAEGLTALSLRRLAAIVGIGTMSIYTYVPGKDELVALMFDQALGEAGVTPPSGDWRADVDAMARATWTGFRRHPWLLDVATARTVFGPNVIAGYDAALAVVGTTGLPPADVVAVVSLVDAFVRGAARNVVDADLATDRTGRTEAEWWAAMAPLLEQRIADGDFPALTALSAAGAFDSPATGVDYMVQRAVAEFEFGLARILDGVAALVELSSRPPTA